MIEPELGDSSLTVADAHAMNPDAVFSALRALGGEPGRVLVVGCEPASVEECMGLSAEVSGAVDEAVRLLLEIVARECREGEYDVPGNSRPDRAVAS